MKRSTVLVTGGAGYIGSICATQLLEHDYSVIVVDDLSTGFREAAPADAIFYQADIGDRQSIRKILFQHRVDAVFHFAAKALVAESVSDPGVFFRENVASSIIMLEELRRAEVRKFVFSSTAAVYGDAKTIPIGEDHPKDPVNSYGETKLMFERALAWYARAYNWGVAALRYFNACGAYLGLGERHDPETHIIPLLLDTAAAKREHFDIFGEDYPTDDGTCVRDYVHVADIADAHIRTMSLLEEPGMRVFNVGTGAGHSVKQVINVVERVTGERIPLRRGDRRPGDPAVLCANPEKLIKALEWEPINSSLENIIQTAWEFRQNTKAVKAFAD